MANVATLTAKMAMDVSGFSAGANKVNSTLNQMKGVAGSASSGVGSLTSGLMAGAAGGAAMAAAVTVLNAGMATLNTGMSVVKATAGGLFEGMKWGAELAAEQEQAQVAFTTMLKSGEAAKAMLTELETFATITPFEFPEVRDTAKNMLAMGVAMKDVQPSLVTLGDIAAGVGAPLQQLGLVFSQVKAAGRLMTQDMNQFTNAGVALPKALAKELGIAETSVRKFVESGKVDFNTFQNALVGLQQTDFAGGMEKQSKTALGALSTLKDQTGGLFKDLATEIGAGFNTTEWINDLAGFVGYVRTEWGPGIAEAFMNTANAIDEALAPLRIGLAHVMRSMATLERAAAGGVQGSFDMFRSGKTKKSGAASVGLNNAALLDMGANAISGATFKQRADQLQKFFKDHSVAADPAKGLEKSTDWMKEANKMFVGSGAKGLLGAVGNIFQDVGFAGGRVAGAFGKTSTPQEQAKPTGAMVAGSQEAFSAIIKSMYGRDKDDTAKKSLETLEAINGAAGSQVKLLTDMLSKAAGGVIASFSG